METQGKFILFNADEFQHFLVSAVINRTITHIQNHHTWSPSYRNFNGHNHFDKLHGMEASHIQRGFNEIGQHITTFPDGSIALCRTMEKDPACIKGANPGGICIENLGNFDRGHDEMTAAHRITIIKVNALLCFKFNLAPNMHTIVYHHWFQLTNGFRDGGKNDDNHKTCPGTNFFGGNTEADFSNHLLPLVQAELATINQPIQLPAFKTGIVHTPLLNVRTGPGISFPVIEKIKENETVSILESNGNWDRIGQSRWVNADYIAVK
jgi:N-acetylmuramoyl-L-alanine amidase/Bacterial SH3 domain